MKTYTYFQNKPLGVRKGSYAVDRDDAVELLKEIIYKDAEQEDGLDDDVVKIKEASTFSNGVKVTIETQDWVVDELQKRFEIRRREIKELA